MPLQNKKSLGQNWLRERWILDEIAANAAGDPDVSDAPVPPVCLEIGPGLGTLTSSLLRRFERVVAVEFDDKLATNLPKSFPGKNLEVIHGDILSFDWPKFNNQYAAAGYVIAGNIPYYLTSPLLRQLLTRAQAERIVLLVQKEVAERIAALTKRSFLTVFVENYATAELGLEVGREFFTPPPKVDSQVIILTPHAPLADPQVLKLAKVGFSAPRKKLLHNLTAGTDLSKEQATTVLTQAQISLDARPGDLDLAAWQRLYAAATKN